MNAPPWWSAAPEPDRCPSCDVHHAQARLAVSVLASLDLWAATRAPHLPRAVLLRDLSSRIATARAQIEKGTF